MRSTLTTGISNRWAAALGLSIALAASAAAGEHWTSFRGPTNQGLCDSANLPLKWSETENVAWKRPVPGKAWSSPVIWGDRIWLTNANEEGTQLFALCVDKGSGKILFKERLHFVPGPQYCHPFNSYASPSPVIEQGRVYLSFGAPYTGCLDSQTGEVIWQRTDFRCNHFRGPGSSPFIYKDLLILHFDGSDHQYVVAMDKHTGKTVWKTDRSVDFQDLDPETGRPKLDGDLRKGFSTPVIAQVDGKDVLIGLASMALYGYEPETGEELWRVEVRGSHSGSSRPVVGHGLVFSPMGLGKGPLWAVRPDGRGVVTDTHVVWQYDGAVPKRSSILLVGELLFMVDDNGVGACVEAKTGKEMWRARLGGNYSASPIYAPGPFHAAGPVQAAGRVQTAGGVQGEGPVQGAGRVYFFDQSGKTTVIEAAPEFRVLATNHLDDGFMASPAVSGDALYLRTKTALYRIEEQLQRGR